MDYRTLFACGLLCTGLLACSGGQAGRASCVDLCTADNACMKALADEGIAPEGSTAGDHGLCNGICSSLRHQRREYFKLAKELEQTADWSHACMPEPAA